MTRIIHIFILAIAVIASAPVTYAQRADMPRPNREQRLTREQLAETEARHIAHELAFDEAVTERFVTTYCNCQKEIWALGPRPRPAQEGASEQENEERIKQRFAMSEKILDIRQKYYKEYSKFLTQTQIEDVYQLERKLMNRHAKQGPKEPREPREPRGPRRPERR